MPLPTIPPIDGYNHLTKQDGTMDVKFKSDPKISQTVEWDTVLHRFEGRAQPLAYFKEFLQSETWDCDFFVDEVADGASWTNLLALVITKTVLKWTDVFGNQINVVASVTPATRDMIIGGVPIPAGGGVGPRGGQYQRVKFKLHRVE